MWWDKGKCSLLKSHSKQRDRNLKINKNYKKETTEIIKPKYTISEMKNIPIYKQNRSDEGKHQWTWENRSTDIIQFEEQEKK